MPRPRLALLLLLLAALLAWGVERLVVTDREAIAAQVEAARTAVLRDDWDAFTALVAEDYAERSRDRAALVIWARGLWRRAGTSTLTVDLGEVRIEDGRAAARVTVGPGLAWAGARFGGRVEFERRDGVWRITGVAPDDLDLWGR